MSNIRFDELELMLMAMFEQPTLKDTIQALKEVQPLVAEDAEMGLPAAEYGEALKNKF